MDLEKMRRNPKLGEMFKPESVHTIIKNFNIPTWGDQVRLQSVKILLLPPKYEIFMLPSNNSNFQYYDNNIGLFSIAPCKVITLNPLYILFGISSLLLFWWLAFLSYRDSCCSFSLFQAIAKRLHLEER